MPATLPAATMTAALDDLCRYLDGLPLAIELAAAQLRTREPAQLCAELAALPGRGLDLIVDLAAGRLPPDCHRLLSALAGSPPAVAATRLPAFLHEMGARVAYLDASVAALAATGLVTVTDRDGRAWVTVPDGIRAALAASAGAVRTG